MLPSSIISLDVAMNLGEPKALHPFFTKPQDIDVQTRSKPSAQFGDDENHAHHSDADYEDSASTPVNDKSAGSSRSRRRKRSESNTAKARSQALLENFARKTVKVTPDSISHSGLPIPNQQTENAILKVEEGSTSKTKKRRKLKTNNDVSVAKEEVIEAKDQEGCRDSIHPPSSPLAWRKQLEVAAHAGDGAVLTEKSSVSQTVDVIPPPKPAVPPTEHINSNATQDVPNESSVGTSPKSIATLPDGPSSHSPRTPPKKMLRLRAGGKFSSPISTSTEPTIVNIDQKAKPKRIRKRSSRTTRRLLVIQYGLGDTELKVRVGKRIDQICASSPRVPVGSAQPVIEKKTDEPPKATHPFFLGAKEQSVPKAATPPPTTIPPRIEVRSPRKAAVTPGKLRSEAISSLGASKPAVFGSTLNRPTAIKHPGSCEAAWPYQGIVHARGILEGHELCVTEQAASLDVKKAKGVATFVPMEDDLLQVLAAQLGDIRLHLEPDENKFPPPPASVRLPERIVTTGGDIRDMVCRELHDLINLTTNESPISADQWTGDTRGHPALLELLKGLDTFLTAFDGGTCETCAWNQKYAPTLADQVLQTPKSMSVLKSWLSGLTVQSVEGASNDSTGASKKNKNSKPAKKRRKKTSDLDDFIVSSEDGDGDMDELTDPEELTPSPNSRQRGKKSMIRTFDPTGKTSSRKLKNMVMISGPNGCGKTAAVYAVAKELQFDVFEINSGSRRSGKDILEKVGDMTENHLVNNGQKDQISTAAVDSDAERAAEAFQKDIASGRQGTMTSFFKPKPAATKKPTGQPSKAKNKPKPAEFMKQLENSLKPRRNQKQSLILLEEVDVLFEEDKSFWSTVIELAVQSKRPIVMTCNNEDIVPMDDISFEAILRFSAPPVNLATGYLLLMAAREGHMLEREAIAQLYKSKSEDLRATITELNFWCQIGVGDRRGGLDWIYQRWPPGKDVNHEGKTLRVASKGTYEAGMGWFNHDLATEMHLGEVVKEELQLELWQDWHIDPLELSVESEENEVQSRSNPSAVLDQLRLWELVSDGQSAADVFCRVGLPLTRPAAADTTQPSLTEKVKLSFECGYPLLQADELVDYQNIDTKIATAMCLSSNQLYNEATFSHHQSLLGLNDFSKLESTCISTILRSKGDTERNIDKLAREHFTWTFEPISSLPPNTLQAGSPNSSFDRPLSIITKDLAPYVRSISASDMRLESERLRLSNILSIGGQQGKRMRTTRASRSALEGGKRETTRRERWFHKTLNLKAVMKTAGETWAAMGTTVPEQKDESEVGSEMASSSETVNSPPA